MSIQNEPNSLWTEKYRPKTLNEYYISKQQLDTVKEWITDLKNQNQNQNNSGDNENPKPFLILHGTAGIGKTTLAHLILQKHGYEIIECNASDTRTKKQLKESIGGIAKVSVCIDSKNKFKPTAIIMDEIDGLNGISESSGVQELIDIVISKNKDSKEIQWVCPVICTTNSIKEKKLQCLLKYGVLLNLSKPNSNDCIKLINKIANAEKFIIPETKKDEIIYIANGDYRQIIMLLYEYYNNLSGNARKDTKDTKNVNINKNNYQNNYQNNYILGRKQQTNNNIIEGDNYTYDISVIKKINNLGDSPLDKINFFFTNEVDLDTIRYFCSGDSNLFFMNFYNNIISALSQIQEKNTIISTAIPSAISTGKEKLSDAQNRSKDKEAKNFLLKSYKVLSKVYDSIKNADLLNNTIFLDKNWELLDYFDLFSVGIPSKIIFSSNTLLLNPSNTNPNPNPVIIKDFNLSHHTQYNYMRQEQALNKKKINIDYMKTYENDCTNIYYNLKRFQYNNEESIIKFGTKSRKKKVLPDENKFIIDKSYGKIVEKINELLL
jgi:DNA polymerase III delta prime subunit